MWNIKQKELFTLPNILSLYRLLSFPFILYFVLEMSRAVFLVLFIISLLTDVLDGFIARKFNRVTRFGARLDSLADEGMYILGLTAIWVFKLSELEPYKAAFLIFACFYFLSIIVSLLKFKLLPALHLYSSKIGGYIQGLFFLVLFAFGFSPFLFYVAIIQGIVSFLEQIIVMLIISEPKTDLKGLYWVLKNN